MDKIQTTVRASTKVFPVISVPGFYVTRCKNILRASWYVSTVSLFCFNFNPTMTCVNKILTLRGKTIAPRTTGRTISTLPRELW